MASSRFIAFLRLLVIFFETTPAFLVAFRQASRGIPVVVLRALPPASGLPIQFVCLCLNAFPKLGRAILSSFGSLDVGPELKNSSGQRHRGNHRLVG